MRFLSIVFALERTNQLSLLPDKDLVDLCPPIEPYQVTKNRNRRTFRAARMSTSLLLKIRRFYPMLVASELKLLFTKINFSCVRLMRFDSKDYSALTGALAQW